MSVAIFITANVRYLRGSLLSFFKCAVQSGSVICSYMNAALRWAVGPLRWAVQVLWWALLTLSRLFNFYGGLCAL